MVISQIVWNVSGTHCCKSVYYILNTFSVNNNLPQDDDEFICHAIPGLIVYIKNAEIFLNRKHFNFFFFFALLF